MSTGGLAERLRQLRTERGLTQQQVAEPAYSTAYISTIETGRRTPSRTALRHFATKLGVTAEELETGLPASFEPEAVLQLQEGWRALYQGDYTRASKLFASVEKDGRRVGHQVVQARALIGRARCTERQGQTEDALGLFQKALELFSAHAPRPAAVEAIAGIARCHQMAGDARLASHVLESFLLDLEGKDLVDPAAVMRTYASLVWPYMELGLHNEANDAALKALKLQARVDAPEEVAGMHLNVARALLNMGRPKDALDSLNKAEEMYRDLNWGTEIARARHNRGMVHMTNGDLEAAREDLRVALERFRDVRYVKSEALVLSEVARLERLLGDTEASVDGARRAVELLSEMEAVPELALAHRELALALRDSKHDEAEIHFRKAIDLYRECGEMLHAADTHRLLGNLLTETRYEEACKEFRAGLDLISQTLDRRDP